MIDEGYIKYQIYWEPCGPSTEDLAELIRYRDLLWQMGLIGVYQELGIGYGNISQRSGKEGLFHVSGTQTGHLSETNADHFSTVCGYDLALNELHCKGPLKASSESLTHAAIYECGSEIQSVIHVHHFSLWEALVETKNCTEKTVTYGTPEMAIEVQGLLKEGQMPASHTFAMGGHPEGIISYGSSVAEAHAKLIACFASFGVRVEK